MTNFIQNVLQISITMAAVIGVLLLLVPVWQKRYSAKWRKAIWLIIAVRLLVPFSIELPMAPVQMHVDMHQAIVLSPQSVPTDANPVPAVPSQIETPSDVTVSTTVNNVTPTVTTEKTIILDRGTVLFALWLVGILVFIMYHAVQYRRFYGKLMVSAKPLEDSGELLDRAGSDMGLTQYPNVLLSSGAQSPMLIGFAKPTIVLPYKLYGENELVMILRHELTHYKHHDLWYKLILLCANALHWFNPLVWLMNRQAGRDIEQVCDDYVVDGMDMDYRKAYSMTILNTMASQKGVALSTHLSKDAQNTKKRFAGILQPKQYKKGIAVLLAVLILAVGISGCLQVGKVDEGVALYEKVSEYLPENAIHNPEVYEVQGLNENGVDVVSYIWVEERYPVTQEEFENTDSLRGYHYWSVDEGYFLYRRTLHVTVSKETKEILSILYANNEDKPDPVKPAEIGRNKEKRDTYVQEIADKFFKDGTHPQFVEGYTETDENNNAIRGYYVHGTEADAKQYVIVLDYIEGHLLWLYSIDYDDSAMQGVEIWRDYTIMLEGMEETVRLYRNREPGYYAMYTDNSIFHRVPQAINIDGAFLDRYVRRVEDSAVQSYMQVGFVPNITVEDWLAKVETDSDFAAFAPQINPLASYLATEWEPTGNYKVFPNEPNRQWREYITISGAYNVCYLTPYRNGVMMVQLSYPFGAEYMEGLGARMNLMIDTLVLAAEGEEYAAKKQNSGASNMDNGIALYNQIAPFLPEDAVENPAEYQRTRHTDYTEYVWGENPFAVHSSSTIPPVYQHPYGLLVQSDNNSGEIINFHYWVGEERLQPLRVDGDAYIQQFALNFIENGETVAFDSKAYISPNSTVYFAIDNTNHYKYQVTLDAQYGFIREYYRQYYNEEYQAQVLDWVHEQFDENLSSQFALHDDVVFGGYQKLNDNQYEMRLLGETAWYPVLTKAQEKALDALQESSPAQYELYIDALNLRYPYSFYWHVTGDVKNDSLKTRTLEAYLHITDDAEPIGKVYWDLVNEKLQIAWNAASYINAWQYGYTDLMALFGATEGVTVHQGDITTNQYELVEACLSALDDYQGGDTVQLEVPLTLSSPGERIVVPLEKKNGQWYVNATPYYFYTGYMHELTDWDNAETVWMADYDGDNTPDPVWRTWDSETDAVQYTLALTDSATLEIGGTFGNLAYPRIDGAELTGDGQNEIVFLAEYPTSTNPLAVGELAVFAKEQGAYHSVALPFEQGAGVYEQKYTVTYNKADGQAIEVSVDGTGFSRIVEIPDHLWNDYIYGSTYVDDFHQSHTVWNYRIQEQEGTNRLVCSIQLFDKWSPWGLDIVLGYEDERFIVEDILFCEDIYEAWM